MRQTTTRAARAAGLAAAALVLLGDAPRAAEPPAQAKPGSGPSCVVTGAAFAPKDLAIFGAPSGGARIAVFSGASTPLKAGSFPADPTTGRAGLHTGAGFRLEGFFDPRAIPVFASRDLPVVQGHVWIAQGRAVRIVGASPGSVRVELPARGSIAQPVQANAPCDALSFGQTLPAPFDVPGSARGYVAAHGHLPLYGAAGGDQVLALAVSGEGSGVLLWGQEVRGEHVHVAARFELFVDAWVRKSDVRALPRGEMMDQLVPPERMQNPPALALGNATKLVQAPRAVAIHLGRGDTTPVIGEIEPGSEVYVMDTLLGWVSVLPKALHVMPADDKAFWVKASDLGIATPAPPAPGKDAGPR